MHSPTGQLTCTVVVHFLHVKVGQHNLILQFKDTFEFSWKLLLKYITIEGQSKLFAFLSYNFRLNQDLAFDKLISISLK